MDAALEAVERAGGISGAARELGIPRGTLQHRVRCAKARGSGYPRRPVERVPCNGGLKSALRSGGTLEDLAKSLGLTRGAVLDGVDALRAEGMNVCQFGDRYSIENEPAPQRTQGGLPEYRSRDDNTFLFGFLSDTHLGSKYERLDVLHELYDRFAEQGVDRVFHAGNWIDGEARFNKFDIHTHGMNPQIQYFVENYPQRDGIVTYAVAGDDHEGWYCQQTGVDIGAYAEMKMHAAGREDWVNLGYIEAFVNLVNAGTGAETKLLVCHPGGGSAYALSYTSQKSVEAFEGGEKPAVALFGHYHKMMYACIRNVHTIQTGCVEDVTPFMRKKKLSAHIGGGICKLTQDPESGAIVACRTEFFNFFNRGFYNGRWSMSGDVVLPERS